VFLSFIFAFYHFFESSVPFCNHLCLLPHWPPLHSKFLSHHPHIYNFIFTLVWPCQFVYHSSSHVLPLLGSCLTLGDLSYLSGALPWFWCNSQFVCSYGELDKWSCVDSSCCLYEVVEAWSLGPISHIHPRRTLFGAQMLEMPWQSYDCWFGCAIVTCYCWLGAAVISHKGPQAVYAHIDIYMSAQCRAIGHYSYGKGIKLLLTDNVGFAVGFWIVSDVLEGWLPWCIFWVWVVVEVPTLVQMGRFWSLSLSFLFPQQQTDVSGSRGWTYYCSFFIPVFSWTKPQQMTKG
jgi:hypothetical protein